MLRSELVTLPTWFEAVMGWHKEVINDYGGGQIVEVSVNIILPLNTVLMTLDVSRYGRDAHL